MFRAIQQVRQRRNRREERTGVVLSANDNGTYRILIGGVEYNALPSAGIEYYRPGETVRVMFFDGRAVIVP